jgi:hypothetical protein
MSGQPIKYRRVFGTAGTAPDLGHHRARPVGHAADLVAPPRLCAVAAASASMEPCARRAPAPAARWRYGRLANHELTSVELSADMHR